MPIDLMPFFTPSHREGYMIPLLHTCVSMT